MERNKKRQSYLKGIGMSNQGGKRKGAGRKPLPPEYKKTKITPKLELWLVEWIRHQDKSQTLLIEQALIKLHNLQPPITSRHHKKLRGLTGEG